MLMRSNLRFISIFFSDLPFYFPMYKSVYLLAMEIFIFCGRIANAKNSDNFNLKDKYNENVNMFSHVLII